MCSIFIYLFILFQTLKQSNKLCSTEEISHRNNSSTMDFMFRQLSDVAEAMVRHKANSVEVHDLTITEEDFPMISEITEVTKIIVSFNRHKIVQISIRTINSVEAHNVSPMPVDSRKLIIYMLLNVIF